MSKMSQREKVLLVVLIVLILGSAYYMFFYKPTQEKKAEYESQLLELDDQILLLEAQAAHKKIMEKELEEILAGDVENIRVVPEFDNSRVLMEVLNLTLSPAVEYNINFMDASVTDGIIRRDANLTYKCVTYEAAKQILTNIYYGQFPCVMHNVSITYNNGYYNTTVEVVYFEYVN